MSFDVMGMMLKVERAMAPKIVGLDAEHIPTLAYTLSMSSSKGSAGVLRCAC